MNNLEKLEKMYNKTIKTEKEAKAFLKEFWTIYPNVHPEDEMSQIVNTKDHSKTFTNKQVINIHERVDEIYCLLEDPCAYIIDELQTEHE